MSNGEPAPKRQKKNPKPTMEEALAFTKDWTVPSLEGRESFPVAFVWVSMASERTSVIFATFSCEEYAKRLHLFLAAIAKVDDDKSIEFLSSFFLLGEGRADTDTDGAEFGIFADLVDKKLMEDPDMENQGEDNSTSSAGWEWEEVKTQVQPRAIFRVTSY